jgi:hypothetical protein
MIRRYSLDTFHPLAPFIARFIEQLVERGMSIYASDLYDLLEWDSEEQFSRTLEKVLDVLHKAGVPAEHHIRPVFAGFYNQTVTDYKMSPLAFALMCVHAEPVTETSARLQVGWLEKALKGGK